MIITARPLLIARISKYLHHSSELLRGGDWSDWRSDAHALAPRHDGSGIWEGFVPGAKHGDTYKYRIESSHAGYVAEKADPFAVASQVPPATASRVWSLDYSWGDGEWMQHRAGTNALGAPISIYEVHLGSWRRNADGTWLGYRQAAHALADYVQSLGYTHVELLPITSIPSTVRGAIKRPAISRRPHATAPRRI